MWSVYVFEVSSVTLNASVLFVSLQYIDSPISLWISVCKRDRWRSLTNASSVFSCTVCEYVELRSDARDHHTSCVCLRSFCWRFRCSRTNAAEESMYKTPSVLCYMLEMCVFNVCVCVFRVVEYSLDLQNINLTAIRTVRVLRPLKAINRVPSESWIKHEWFISAESYRAASDQMMKQIKHSWENISWWGFNRRTWNTLPLWGLDLP